jgi:hypothetical protein
MQMEGLLFAWGWLSVLVLDNQQKPMLIKIEENSAN